VRRGLWLSLLLIAAMGACFSFMGCGGSFKIVQATSSHSPTITGVSTDSASTGGANIKLNIMGANFTPDSTANWNTTPLATSYINTMKLTVAVPVSLVVKPDTASITVSTAEGTASTTVSTTGGNSPEVALVTAASAPTITSLSPDSALAGAQSLTLTVNGSNYLPGDLATVVRWNSSALTTTYVSSTQVTAALPASMITIAGTGTVSVVTAGGSSSGAPFTINHVAPSLTSTYPSQVPAGYGGFTMEVYGKYFTSPATVYWGTTPLETTFVGGSLLSAVVPASLVASTGAASITVTAAWGTSAPVAFTIKQPSPVIASVSPDSAAAGGAAFTLTVNGSYFIPSSEVWLESTHLNTTYVSATQLTADVPANLIATAGVTNASIYTPGIGSSNPAAFTINPSTPTITSLSPSTVTAGGAGFMLTIKGKAFTTDAASTWGTTSLDTIYVSATQLTVAVPASLIEFAGTSSITVTTPAGTSSAATFTIKPSPPAISGLSPSLATAGGAAFTLAISGQYFTSASTVKWGLKALATTYVSATQLTAAVPANLIAAAGTASIKVATAAGTSSAATFTINPSLTIATTTLPSGVVGNAYSGPIHVMGGVPGYNWTVTGLSGSMSYFNTSGSTLTINGTPASTDAVTFQVSVADTTGTTVGPVTYTINVAAGPDGVNNGKLNGRYVCLLQGFNDSDSSRWASLISFLADGQGNFSSGILDTNSHDIGSALGTMTGSYNIGADNNGFASVHTILTDGAAGIQTTRWAMALATAAQPAQQFRMVESDDLGALPSGQQGTANCYMSTPSAFAGGLSGQSFSFGLDGEDNSGNRKAAVGRFSASGGKITAGNLDVAQAGNATVHALPFTGSYTAPDATTGRFTAELQNAGSTTGFTVYMIDANRMFVLDNTSNDGEQAGNIRTQQQASYSGANLAGQSVLYTRGAEFNNGSTTPSGFYANLFEQTGDGAGNLTISQSYANDNGSYSAGGAKDETLALTFDSTYPGRATFPSANGTTYLYLFDANSALAMNVNVAGSLDFGWLEAQTQAAVTGAALAGNYLFGELPLLSGSANGSVGEYELDSSGAITAAISTAGQELFSWDQTVRMTYGADATVSGTGTSLIAGTESEASCAVLNTAKFVCVSQTDSAPAIEVFEQD
jgi:hypothetical protein